MYICIFVYIYIYIYIYIFNIYIYIYIYIYIFIYHKQISPLSILIHLRVINLPCLKQHFDDCLFQVSLLHVQFFYLQSLLSKLLHLIYTLPLPLEAS